MLDFLLLAQQCAPLVAPETMRAIVKTESGFNPLSIGVNGGARLVRQPASKAEAVVTAQWLIEQGYNIDLGLGQVNSTNLSKVGLSIEDSFDPCKNIAAAATILYGNYKAAKAKVVDDQEALHSALSAYNTGSFTKGFANGYVQRVINNAGTTTPGTPPQAVVPIALLNGKPAVKRNATPAHQPVKLVAEGRNSAPQQSVYGDEAQNIMVY